MCCNKCCPTGDPTVEEFYDRCKVNDHHRKCTDLGCLLIFFVWWIMWIGLMGVALSKGEPIQLIYGQDYQGAQCGVYDDDSAIKYPNHHNQTRVVYPRMQEDLEEWVNGETSLSNIYDIDWLDLDWNILGNLNLTGICVNTCPKLGDVICTDAYNHEVASSETLNPIDAAKCRTDSVFKLNNQKMCDNCWTTAIDTTDLFYRCLEVIHTDEVKTETCVFPKGISAASNNCITIKEVITATSLKPGYSNPLAEILGDGLSAVNQVLSDFINSADVIFVTGVLLCLVFAFIYIVFLKWCAGCLIYTTIITYVMLHAWLCYWLWMQSGIIDQSLLHGDTSTSSDTVLKNPEQGTRSTSFTNSTHDQVNDDNAELMYTVAAIVCTVVYAVAICVIAAFINKIRIAVKIIQEASKALMAMPTLLLYPCWSVFFFALLTLYFVVGGAYLSTMEHVDINGVANSVGLTSCTDVCDSSFVDWTAVIAGCDANGFSCPVATLGCTLCAKETNVDWETNTKTFMYTYLGGINDKTVLNCTEAQISEEVYSDNWLCGVPFLAPTDNLTQAMMWFHLFSFLWNANFIDAIGVTIIAGAVCQWYWIYPDAKTKKKTMPSRWPMFSAFTRVYRFHLGSMAYGSAVLAIVQLLRAIMAYISRKTKDLQKKSRIVRCLMCCVSCLLWCFEKSIKFITKNAYIYVAMRGYNFCKAARVAFWTFVHNMMQFAVTSLITTIFLTIGKICITIGVAVAAWTWIEYDEKYQEAGSHALHFPLLPVALAALMAYFCSKYFLNIYHIAISSVLLCFCEDYKMHASKPDKQHLAFMSNSLRAAVCGGKTLTAEKIQAAIDKGATVDDLKKSLSGINLPDRKRDKKLLEISESSQDCVK